MFLSTVTLLLTLGCFGYGVYLLFKRQSKKSLQSFGLGVLFFFVTGVVAPESIRLDLEKDNVQTNSQGFATIKGKTNPSAELTIDGEEIQLKENGSFSHRISLSTANKINVQVTSDFKKSELNKTVTVSPSIPYKKALAKKKEEQELARLKKQATEKRIRHIKEANTAITLAEKEPTDHHLEQAKLSIHQLEDLDDDLLRRLGAVETLISHKKEIDKATLIAEKALNLVEENSTQQNYEKASEAIKLLPEKNEHLTNRLVAVNKKMLAQEEQRQQQENQNNQATQSEDNQQNVENTEMVLITPTGSKYHRKVCGNGSYRDATLEQAQSSGLSPCSKCFR